MHRVQRVGAADTTDSQKIAIFTRILKHQSRRLAFHRYRGTRLVPCITRTEERSKGSLCNPYDRNSWQVQRVYCVRFDS